MRILVISNLYPPAHLGGYEQECARVVDHLRRSHDVRVLTSRHGRDEVAPAKDVRRVLPFERERKLDSLRAPLTALSAARIVRAELAAFDPDLIYVWNGTRIPQSALRIAETAGRPLAYRVCEHWFGRIYRLDLFMRHLSGADTGVRRIWAAGMRLVNRHPTLRLDLSAPAPAAISWVSETLRRQTSVPPTTTPVLERTIHWGVELPAEVPRREPPEPLFAFVGRLIPQKGADLACRALARLESEHEIRARLVLIGPEDAAHGRDLRRLVARLGLDERVEFRGPLDPEDVRGELAGVTAVVVPSRWQEPAGLVPVESAALGVPVVAARSGGLVEMLREDEHALFFDIDDVEACADALAAVVRNPGAARERAARARERAAEFGLDRYHGETDAFLADAVSAYPVSAAATTSAMASTE